MVPQRNHWHFFDVNPISVFSQGFLVTNFVFRLSDAFKKRLENWFLKCYTDIEYIVQYLLQVIGEITIESEAFSDVLEAVQ